MITKIFFDLGEKKFVVDQVMYWIYKKYCFNFLLMFNISIELRNKLFNLFNINLPKIIDVKYSFDGVIKWLLLLSDGNCIETVYIPEKNRNTLCISSQVGCIVNCSFCATGKIGFKRNLYTCEIIGQILLISNLIKNEMNSNNRITNIVFMGMGEPLLNFKNVVTSINIILDFYGLNFSKRKVVLSTSGVVPYIYKLINLIDIVLVISLHAPNDILRSKIMSINNRYNLYSLLKAMKCYIKYSKSNKNKLNIEYIMLDNINDSEKYAYQLVNLLKNIPSKINLIPYNNMSKYNLYKKSTFNRVLNFRNILKRNGIFSFIRVIRGFDINASCGQLSVINK